MTALAIVTVSQPHSFDVSRTAPAHRAGASWNGIHEATARSLGLQPAPMVLGADPRTHHQPERAASERQVKGSGWAEIHAATARSLGMKQGVDGKWHY